MGVDTFLCPRLSPASSGADPLVAGGPAADAHRLISITPPYLFSMRFNVVVATSIEDSGTYVGNNGLPLEIILRWSFQIG